MNNFWNIIKDIIQDERFKQLINEPHHGDTRYNHNIRVAKIIYSITKLYSKHYIEDTRAALLHDFFTQNDVGDKNEFTIHSHLALKNASSLITLTNRQKNIIEAHMFPINFILPKSISAWLVSIIDKEVAIYELFRFKILKKLDFF